MTRTAARPTTLAIFDVDPERRYQGTEPRLVQVLRAFSNVNDRRAFAHIVDGDSYNAVPFELLEF